MKRRWLLLRGLCRESKHWGPFLPSFRKSFPDDDVIPLDLPGFGNSPYQKSPLSIEKTVTLLRKQWHTSERDFILGISLGSMLSIHWANQFPEDFKGAVLINTSAKNVASPWKRMKPSFLKLIPQLLSTTNAYKKERLILKFISHWPENRPLPYETSKPSLHNAIRQLMAASQFSVKKVLPIPSLCLCSKGDQLLDSKACLKTGEKLGAQQQCHPSAGHDLPLDQPEWVIKQIHSWLEKSSL